MKGFMRRIDSFCAKHPGFGIPNLMLYIVIGNAIVWFFSIMDPNDTLYRLLSFNAGKIFLHGQIWRLFTFVIVPQIGNILLLIALYFYYFIGRTLESAWGSGKFTIYYLCGVLLTIIYGTVIWLVSGYSYGLDAMYINMSMFFAFATLYPETTVLLWFIIPIKIKWLGYLNAGFFIIEMIKSPFPINLLPLIAFVNYLLFCGGWLFDKLPKKKSKNVIDFQREMKKYNKEQAKKPYNRKCEVCGRTDTDYPDLEFRYCSKCEGYHCFCIDHINSHVHFKK